MMLLCWFDEATAAWWIGAYGGDAKLYGPFNRTEMELARELHGATFL